MDKRLLQLWTLKSLGHKKKILHLMFILKSLINHFGSQKNCLNTLTTERVQKLRWMVLTKNGQKMLLVNGLKKTQNLKKIDGGNFGNKKRHHNTVHIAGQGSVVRQLRILATQFRVLRTGTLSEIRPDNMYQPLSVSLKLAT